MALAADTDSRRMASSNTIPQEPSSNALPQDSAVLPVELVVMVAEFLAGEDCYGTLANLNITCELIRTETMVALCETVVITSDYTDLVFESGTSVVDRFLTRHGKYIRYLVVPLDFSLPSEVSNLLVKITRSRIVVYSDAFTAHEIVDSTHASIYGAVSAAVLDNLVRLSWEQRREVIIYGASGPALLEVQEVVVHPSGRVVAAADPWTCSWTFARSTGHANADLTILAGEGLENLVETMQCLYRNFPLYNPEAFRWRRNHVNISLCGDISMFNTFIQSLEHLLEVCPHVVPTIIVQSDQITNSDIVNVMPTIAALYVRNWERLDLSRIHPDCASLLEFLLAEDLSVKVRRGVWLYFDVREDDTVGDGGNGVILSLVNYMTQVKFYEETYSALRAPWRR